MMPKHPKIHSTDWIDIHACDCAQLAFEEFNRRGWSTILPSYEEMRDALENETDRN